MSFFSDIDDRLFCEREWIDEIDPSLNTMRRPRITEEERKQWNKDYYQRPEVKERQRAYMEDYNKKYREENRDKLKADGKEWREKNKEAIKAKRETDEYKHKKNERRRNKVHHCAVCDVDIKGDSCAFKQHCKTKLHIEKAGQLV
jgi:hypothetical protein